MYTLEVEQEIVFDVEKNDAELRVMTETWPITHPSNLEFCCMLYYFSNLLRYTLIVCAIRFVAYYNLPDDKKHIVDYLTITEGTKINWRMMETVIRHVDNVDVILDDEASGDYDLRRVYAFAHTLTWSDCNKNFVVIFYVIFFLPIGWVYY